MLYTIKATINFRLGDIPSSIGNIVEHQKTCRKGQTYSYEVDYFEGTVIDDVVIDVLYPEVTTIQFLQKGDGSFRWPRADDVAEVDGRFVISSDFEIVTTNGRTWDVPELDYLGESYEQFRASNSLRKHANLTGSTMHLFSRDRTYRQKWERFVRQGRAHWTHVTATSVICGAHYVKYCRRLQGISAVEYGIYRQLDSK